MTSPIVLLAVCTYAFSSPAQQQPAPVLAKTLDNNATGGERDWDFSGTDLTFKETLKELWVLDGHITPAPLINIFSVENLQAAKRRIVLNLPQEVTGASVLGIAEIPFGDYKGNNLILVDPSFGGQAAPQPQFCIFDDQGNQVAGTPLFSPQGLEAGAVISSIDVNPEREEIVAYDIASHSFYILDFNFNAMGTPARLLGSPNFFEQAWYFGDALLGAGIGICYNGPNRILATSGFFNAFETHFILEYDLDQGGLYSGSAVDLSLAGTTGLQPDLAFAGIDAGKVGDEDAVFAMNYGDDSIYAFGLLSQEHGVPVAISGCSVLETGEYQIDWSLEAAFVVDSVHIFENGVQVATVVPAALRYVSPLPLLGSAFISLATEKAGQVSGIRPVCQIENSGTPPLEGVQSIGIQVTDLGEIAAVAVTRTPASLSDFRGYLMGLDSNRIYVFNHLLDVVETLQPIPAVTTQGANLAAVGVTLLRRNGEDVLAILDQDGPTGGGTPSADLYSLQGASRGQRVAEINPIDLTPIGSAVLLDWDSDATNGIVAGAILGNGYGLVRLRYDEATDTIVAEKSAPLPQGSLTPFLAERPVGVGVSILPSGNLLVAGADVFSRTYNEALLVTPFDDDPARSVKMVGYAQGLPVSGSFFSGIGPGIGPSMLTGLDTAYFPPANGDVQGIGVTYLPTGNIFLITNPAAGMALFIPGNILLHLENRCSHPDLQAHQLAEVVLDIQPGGLGATETLAIDLAGVSSADVFYTIFNDSPDNAIRLSVEVFLDDVSIPETVQDIDLPAGRYFRRALYGRLEGDIRVEVKNSGTIPAAVRVVVGAMGIGSAEVLKRGDCDGNGAIDLSDPIYSLNYQFLAGEKPGCFDACDADDDGKIDLTDAIYILTYQYLAGPEPLPPGPITCGTDPSADTFEACVYAPSSCR